ncbi:MAG: sugar isomerase domain-containing protein [Erysipelotrichaceae bacterium]|nr:sugar isomerase domain-containing protein [Erysipelotrichaceae bacterium]
MQEVYHQQVKQIFQEVFDTQPASIIKACELGYASVRQGHRFYVLGTGHSHMMPEELYARLKGTDFFTPIIMPEFMLHQFPNKSTAIERLAPFADIVLSMYPLRAGDTLMLVSNSGRNGLLVELALRAKQLGANLITCANYKQAQVITSRHVSGKNMVHFADVVIDNCGFFGDACHELQPGLMIGSTSNMVTVLIAQMMNAVMINMQEGQPETNAQVLKRFANYFWDCFNATLSQKAAVEQAAEAIFAAIRDEHRFFVYGGGHSHLITEELYSRAGGLACINPILEDEIMVHQSADKSNLMETSSEYAHILMKKYGLEKNDVLLLVSNSGKGNLTVEFATIAKKAGVKVIALTNTRQSAGLKSSHKSEKRLFEVADLIIDNCAPVGDAAFVISGREGCPLSSSLGCYLAQSLAVDLCYVMLKNQFVPPVLVSANIEEAKTPEEKKIREISNLGKTKYKSYFIYQGPRLD